MDYLTHEELHAALFDLLCSFDDFARKNDIRYSLIGGTLLGAIRHKGFIPWDDDIDVGIPRPDFDRLIDIARNTQGRYRVVGPMDDVLPYPFAKYCDTTIRCQERQLSGSIEEYLWVDLFPLDGISTNPSERQAEFAGVQRLKGRAGGKFLKSPNKLKAAIKAPYRCVASRLFPPTRDYAALDRLARSVPYGSTGFCKDVVWSPYPGTQFRESDFEDLSMVEFEGRKFFAVAHWDEALRSTFGDYMKIPPENERDTHNVKAWHVRAYDDGYVSKKGAEAISNFISAKPVD